MPVCSRLVGMRRLQGNRRRGLRLVLMRVAGRVFLGVALISVALGFLTFDSFDVLRRPTSAGHRSASSSRVLLSGSMRDCSS